MMRRTREGLAMLGRLLMGVVLAAPVMAQSPLARDGGRLAVQWCAHCHAVTRSAPPPSGDAAPGFPAIAAMPSTTETSLRVFLQTPHANMPNYQLSHIELDAVVAYLLSLRR